MKTFFILSNIISGIAILSAIYYFKVVRFVKGEQNEKFKIQ